MKKRQSQRGFTIIETVTYAAVLVVISMIAINSVLAMSRALATLRSSQGVADSASSAYDIMIRDIRSAGSVTASSTLNASPGKLVLNTGVQLYLFASTTIIRQEGTSTPYAIVASSTPVTSLVFKKMVTASSTGVTIDAVIGGKTFHTTTVLRGAY